MTWKVRLSEAGVHLFDRVSGLNVLLGDLDVPTEQFSHAPRYLSVALTNACELRCAYCYAPKHVAALDMERVIAWAVELDGAGCLGVGFGGGEPTVHPHFVQRLAPFQILAGEGKVHALTDHLWHLDVLGRLAEIDPTTFRATQTTTVDLDDETSEAAAIAWWEELTGKGGEGMVVKPVDVAHRGPKGLTQPGIKCRGPEYLRIIYGPEYTADSNLSRLRSRGLGHKRSLALREFALGIEALERFVAGEPLYRVHECVFGVLALESEPVDPRL